MLGQIDQLEVLMSNTRETSRSIVRRTVVYDNQLGLSRIVGKDVSDDASDLSFYERRALVGWDTYSQENFGVFGFANRRSGSPWRRHNTTTIGLISPTLRLD
jgi:hypothetical protein